MDTDDQSLVLSNLAFSAILLCTQQPIRKYIHVLIHNAAVAQEITQDVFRVAWQATLALKSPFTVSTSDENARLERLTTLAELDPHIRRWLFRIAYNLSMTTLRRQYSENRANSRWLREFAFSEISPDNQLDSLTVDLQDLELEDLVLHKALAALKPLNYTCYILHYVYDFPMAEIAAITGRSPEAVKRRVARTALVVSEAYHVLRVAEVAARVQSTEEETL